MPYSLGVRYSQLPMDVDHRSHQITKCTVGPNTTVFSATLNSRELPRFRLLLLLLSFAPDTATAQEAGKREQKATQKIQPGALPVAAAVIPGAVVHGTGHFVAGDRKTAGRLLALQAVSVGLIASGGGTLVALGANRRLSGPAIGSLAMGVGLFTTSWFADIYGAAGGSRIAGTPELRKPPVHIGIAHRYVADPQFAYEQFVGVQSRLRLGPWFLGGSGWFAVDDDNQRLRLESAYRFLGPGLGIAKDGSRLDLVGATTYHRYGSDDFATTAVELDVRGRLDLARISSSLRGVFVDANAGVGLEWIQYRVSGVGADVVDMLLLGFGFGMYIGSSPHVRGEWSLYYDHRRDGFAGGFSPGRGNGSGFAGHFGTKTLLHINQWLGVAVDVQIGAAFITTTGLHWRIGEPK